MRIVFFSPNAAITPHFSAEVRLARILSKNSKNEIIFLTCNSFYGSECTVSRYLTQEKSLRKKTQEHCSTCSKAIKVSKIEKDFIKLNLTSYFGKKEAAIISDYLPQIEENPIQFVFKEIEFGKISSYELILEFKKSNLVFEGNQKETLINFTENAFRTYLAAHQFIKVWHPDRVVIFNAQYSQGASFAEACRDSKVRVDLLTFSPVLSEMRQYIKLWNWDKYKLLNPALTLWNKVHLSPTIIEKYRLKRYFSNIRKAISPWTYSSPAAKIDIRKFHGISKDSKIIFAVMNSLDENIASCSAKLIPEPFSKMEVFKSQEEWITSLAEYVSKLSEVVLIVRPHPREFPNKREKATAEVVQKRENVLKNLPGNVYIDHPKFGVSIEDYFDQVALITTGWSSVGLEWQMRGKICVTFDANLLGYPADTHLSGLTKDEYFKNLDKAINNNGINLKELTVRAQNWFYFSNMRGSLRLGSSILDEPFIFLIAKKIKILGILNKYFPNFKIQIDLNSIGISPKSSRIRKYFESELDNLY